MPSGYAVSGLPNTLLQPRSPVYGQVMYHPNARADGGGGRILGMKATAGVVAL
jgi:hypothetical protein